MPIHYCILTSHPISSSSNSSFGPNAAGVESDNPVQKSGVKTDSEGAQKWGDSSQNRTDSGKPVRGACFMAELSFVGFDLELE